jgi:hypothetical protein
MEFDTLLLLFYVVQPFLILTLTLVLAKSTMKPTNVPTLHITLLA